MTISQNSGADRLQEQFGRRVVARLSGGTAELPHDLGERLRAARAQALARRRVVAPQPAWQLAAASGRFSLGDVGLSLWGRLASAVPVVMLAAGLVAINMIQNDRRASEVAEVDAALLTDDLPPAAYTDPGFVQFLKTGQ